MSQQIPLEDKKVPRGIVRHGDVLKQRKPLEDKRAPRGNVAGVRVQRPLEGTETPRGKVADQEAELQFEANHILEANNRRERDERFKCAKQYASLEPNPRKYEHVNE